MRWILPGLGLIAGLAAFSGAWETALSQSQGTVPGAPQVQNAAPAVTFTLPSGMVVTLDIPNAVVEGATNGERVVVVLDPKPQPPNESAAGILGGGDVIPVSPPVDINLAIRNIVTGTDRPVGSELDNQTIALRLPVLQTSTDPDMQFAWLREVRVNGEFAGYFRDVAVFDPVTNSLVLQIPVSAFTGTLFLPGIMIPAYVANFDPQAHILSSPFADAVDFGVAGPAFTRFKVVGPQVIARIYVFDSATNGYGWIEAAGVGPVAVPTP